MNLIKKTAKDSEEMADKGTLGINVASFQFGGTYEVGFLTGDKR